jgi:AcrR family transcriptional regulator
MKTLKQIADELGVSKQTVYKRYKGRLRERLLPYAHTIDGIVHIEEQGETIIKSDFNANTTRNGAHTDAHTEAHINNTLYVVLQSELEAKNKLIDDIRTDHRTALETKDKQISDLSSQLAEERQHSREQSERIAILADQAQKLQLLATNTEPPPADEQEEEIEIDEITVIKHEMPAPKRKFFGLFGKR